MYRQFCAYIWCARGTFECERVTTKWKRKLYTLKSVEAFEVWMPASAPLLAVFVFPGKPQVPFFLGWVDPGTSRYGKKSAQVRSPTGGGGEFNNHYTIAAPTKLTEGVEREIG